MHVVIKVKKDTIVNKKLIYIKYGIIYNYIIRRNIIMKMFFKKILYVFYMIGTIFKGIKHSYIKRFKGIEKGEAYLTKIFYQWAKFTLDTIGIEVSINGVDKIPKERCLFIGNHTSILDIPIMFYASNRMMGFIAKEETMKIPIISYWLKKSRCIPLNRSNAREAVKSISLGVEYLNEGYSMAIFPEGTRSEDGKIGEFKKGSLKLAIRSKAPIVPVAIEGAYKCFEEEGRFKPSKVKVTFGEPIFTKELTRKEEVILMDEVKKEIINMI